MRKLMLIAGSALIFSAGVAAAGQPGSPGIVDGQAFGQARADYASTHGGPRSDGASTGYYASQRKENNPFFNGVGAPNPTSEHAFGGGAHNPFY